MKQTENNATKNGSFSKSVIAVVLVFIVLFTIAVMITFVITNGSEPSTLIVSVFGFCGFECGIMGWIKTAKEKKDVNAIEMAMAKAKEQQNNATESGDEQEIE